MLVKLKFSEITIKTLDKQDKNRNENETIGIGITTYG